MGFGSVSLEGGEAMGKRLSADCDLQGNQWILPNSLIIITSIMVVSNCALKDSFGCLTAKSKRCSLCLEGICQVLSDNADEYIVRRHYEETIELKSCIRRMQ